MGRGDSRVCPVSAALRDGVGAGVGEFVNFKIAKCSRGHNGDYTVIDVWSMKKSSVQIMASRTFL